VIFSYGIHGPRKRIFDNVLRNLGAIHFILVPITLMCGEAENTRRMMQDGRETERIERGLRSRFEYEGVKNPVIDTTHLTVEDTVEEVIAILRAELEKHRTRMIGRISDKTEDGIDRWRRLVSALAG